MPIHPRHRGLYPLDRRQLSASIRFWRASGRCECCGRPHAREVIHLGDELWWDQEARAWRCGTGKRHRRLPPPNSTSLPMQRTRVFLSTCHLDHDPTNRAAATLAALCHRCHLLNDA